MVYQLSPQALASTVPLRRSAQQRLSRSLSARIQVALEQALNRFPRLGPCPGRKCTSVQDLLRASSPWGMSGAATVPWGTVIGLQLPVQELSHLALDDALTNSLLHVRPVRSDSTFCLAKSRRTRIFGQHTGQEQPAVKLDTPRLFACVPLLTPL